MPIQIDDIRFYYSGGSANSLASASLGGLKSSTRVISQLATFLTTTLTGISVLSANNNAQGNGTLTYNPTNQSLTWQPPTSIYSYSVSVTGNGNYSVGGSDGMLFVSVVFASLPVITKSDTLQIVSQVDKVFPAVSAGQSLAGSTQYRCLYVYNNHASLTASGLVLYIAQETTGPDSIYVGLDPAGIGDGATTGVATTIVDQFTAPAGVTFSEPLSSGTALSVGNLAPGQTFAFWQKRVVLPNSVGYLSINTSKIGVALTS